MDLFCGGLIDAAVAPPVGIGVVALAVADAVVDLDVE